MVEIADKYQSTELEIYYVVLDSKINAISLNESGTPSLNESGTPKKWVLIGRYDGGGDGTSTKDINNFTVNADLWKVYWSAKTDQQDSIAWFTLGFIGQDNRLVYFASATPDDFAVSSAFGVNYAVGKGEYSISVVTTNVNSWVFTVYAYQ